LSCVGGVHGSTLLAVWARGGGVGEGSIWVLRGLPVHWVCVLGAEAVGVCN